MTTVAEFAAKLGLKVDGGSFAQGDKLLEGIRHGVEALAVHEGLHLFKEMVSDVIELGSHLNDLSQSTGASIEELQELGYAAKLNSSDLDSMAAGLNKLSKNMYAAAHGGEEQAKAFAAMGIKVTDAQGKLRPTADVMGDIADRMKSMPDGAQKTAEAMSVMGRSGASLIPTLNGGSQGLAEMRKEARDLGVVMDEQSVHKLDDLGDSVDKAKMGLKGLRNTVVLALVPALQDAANGMVEWIKANRVEVAAKVKAVFLEITRIVQKLTPVLTFLGRAARVAYEVFGAVWSALEQAYDAVAKMVAGNEALRDVLIGVGIVAGIVAIALIAPWALVVAGIAAVILIVQDLYEWFTGGPSLLGDAFAALEYWFNTSAPNAVRVWWNVQKGMFEFFVTEFQALIWLLKQVINYYSWIANHAQDIADIFGGPIAGKALDWATGGGTVDTAKAGKSVLGSQDAMSNTVAAQKMFGTPGEPMIGGFSGTQLGAMPAPAVQVAAPTFNATFHIGDQAKAGEVRDEIEGFWHSKMRELQAQTEKP